MEKSVKIFKRKNIAYAIAAEDKITFTRSKYSLAEKTDIIKLFDLLLNNKKLTQEEKEVDSAIPIIPYLENRNKAINILIAVDIRLYRKGFLVSPME
jgi:hypothetical protein